MLITLYKIGGVHFRLLGTNGFRVKAKKKRVTAASSRCRQNLKYENFPSSFGRLRQNIAPKSVPHVQHDYFSSFNQSNHWFVALSLTLPSSDLKLPIKWPGRRQERHTFANLIIFHFLTFQSRSRPINNVKWLVLCLSPPIPSKRHFQKTSSQSWTSPFLDGSLIKNPRGGLQYGTDGDARRKFWI